MKEYISEGRAMYEDENHGLFSKRLAKWAIGKMMMKDAATGEMKRLKPRSIEEMQEVMKTNGVQIQDEFLYTAWYLFNMAIADYPKTLETDKSRALFVDETLNDPDGSPENVLDCFEVKMCNKGVPIFWENML